MKRYKKYMDSVNASDTLRQRLRELKQEKKRGPGWRNYGAAVAALALVLGLGGGAHYWNTVVDPRVEAFLEKSQAFDPAAHPDVILEDPSEAGKPGLGGYEYQDPRFDGMGVVCYRILPDIEYGEVARVEMALDWDIPAGAYKKDLTRDDITALLGGENAVSVHLDWGGYELTGWGAWYENGSFWGAYIMGYAGPLDHFEFAVTADQLPPTCIAHENSVTQEVRGLTVTADKYDGEHGCDRRVSFMKDDYGYRFDLSSTDTEQAERLVSRLVCWAADEGPALTYTCPYCGHSFPFGSVHNDPMISGEKNFTCPDCGETFAEDGWRAHVHSFNPDGPVNNAAVSAPPLSASDEPYVCTGYPIPEQECGIPDMDEPPCLNVLCGGSLLASSIIGYEWSYPAGNGENQTAIACGRHPMEYQDVPSLTTGEEKAKLNFAGTPDEVRAVCWPDSERDNYSAAGQTVPVNRNELTLGHELSLKEGGWTYEVTAKWDGLGTVSYVFHITKD